MRKRAARTGLVVLLLSVLLPVQVSLASPPFAATPLAVTRVNSAPSYVDARERGCFQRI
jgi:hypothetical protein